MATKPTTANNKEQEEPKPRRRVKKVKGHGGHHGGAWKVAYADFVTAMMALFLVLWLVSQADTKLKEAIASYFRSPGVFDTMAGGVLSAAKKVSKEPTALSSKDEEQALFNVAESLQKKFNTRPEFSRYKDQVKVDVTDEGLRIQILDKAERVSFQVGSSDLTDEAKTILTEVAQTIKELPNPIMIGGHTDARPFQSANGYTNWELSADRANSARRFLATVGIDPKQVTRIIGYADSDLLTPDDPYSPSNRRISITVKRTAPIPADESKPAENAKPGDPPKHGDEHKTEPKKEAKSADLKEAGEADKKVDDAKNKLAKEGVVVVGEADEVPNVSKTKEKKH
jgi:chemotaxis protein MotB